MEKELITEPVGFKILIGGGIFSSISSWFDAINWGAVAGGVVMAVGLLIQVLAFLRGRRSEKREIEKHRIEMAVLKRQLDEINL